MASSEESAESRSAVLEVTSQERRVNRLELSKSCNEDNETLSSPSAESISTFQDYNKMTDLRLDRGADIVSHVDEPVKVVASLGTYVSFRIRTRTARWDSEEKEYTVRRRYNDFKALREKLVESSLQVVPPLPMPHTLIGQLDRFSRDFVLQRMVSLNIFIKRLVSHSILTHNSDLKVFLTASSSEFSQLFKSKGNYLTNISDSLCNLTAPNISTALGSSCRIRDPEFLSVSEYMTSLHEKLSNFLSISTRITKDRNEVATEMKNMRPLLENWSQVECFNRDTLKRTPAKSSFCPDDVDFPLGVILKRMAVPFSDISTENAKLVKEYPYVIANPIREYVLYIEAVKEKLSKREALQGCLEGAQEKLARRKDRNNGAVNAFEDNNSQLPKLTQDVGSCHDRLQCASEALRSDISGWQKQKKVDLKLVLLEICKRQIDFYETSLHSWEEALAPKDLPVSNHVDCLKKKPSVISLESTLSDFQGVSDKQPSFWDSTQNSQ